MKRTLIKIALVLLVVYISGDLSLKYSIYTARTLQYSLAIDLLYRTIPGFLCGLIIGYESMLPFVKSKSAKLDLRYILLSVFLIAIVLSPYLPFVFPITVTAPIMKIERILMTTTFSIIASLLAGYCLTQSFSLKK